METSDKYCAQWALHQCSDPGHGDRSSISNMGMSAAAVITLISSFLPLLYTFDTSTSKNASGLFNNSEQSMFD